MQEERARLFAELKQTEDFFTKARILRHLTKERGLRIRDLAEALDMKASYICHILRLNKLSDIIVDGYYSKLISISHLFIISRLKLESDILAVYEKVLGQNLSVLQTEELVRERLYGTRGQGDRIPEDKRKSLTEKLKLMFPGAEVAVLQTRVKTRVTVQIKGSPSDTSPILLHSLK